MKQITATELRQLMEIDQDLLLLDVRQPNEYAQANIPNSMLLPLNELATRIVELEAYKNRQIIVYCKAGVRSLMACKFMAEHGFSQLTNLVDGISAWQLDD